MFTLPDPAAGEGPGAADPGSAQGENERAPAAEAPLDIEDRVPPAEEATAYEGVLPPSVAPRTGASKAALVQGIVTAPEWLDFPAAVEVTLAPQTGTEGASRSLWVTAEKRSFQFEEVPFGDWRLSTAHEGFEPVTQLLSLRPDDPVRHILLALRPGHRIRGRVADYAGRRVGGIQVAAYWVADDPSLAMQPLVTRADAEGDFVIEGVRPGVYRMQAGPPRSPVGEPREIQILGGEAWVDLAVPPFGSARVKVIHLDTGEALGGVRVVAQKQTGEGPGHGASGTSTSDGKVIFAYLPPGQYSFTAYAAGSRARVVRAAVIEDTTSEVEIAITTPER